MKPKITKYKKVELLEELKIIIVDITIDIDEWRTVLVKNPNLDAKDLKTLLLNFMLRMQESNFSLHEARQKAIEEEKIEDLDAYKLELLNQMRL